MKRIFLILLSLLMLFSSFTLAQAETADNAAIEKAVMDFLTSEMVRLAPEAEDGWQAFIYEQGISSVEMDLEKFDFTKEKPLAVTAYLASGQYSLKTLPAYDGHPEAWLETLGEALCAPTAKVKLSLSIIAVKDGYAATYAPKAEKSLSKGVISIAAKAKSNFASKSLTAVVADYILPTPIAVGQKAPESLTSGTLQPAYSAYVQRNGLGDDANLPWLLYSLYGYSLDISKGPNALTLTYSYPDPLATVTTASKAFSLSLSYDAAAKSYAYDALDQMLALEIEQEAIKIRHGKQKGDLKGSYTFDLFSLPSTISPEGDLLGCSTFNDVLFNAQVDIYASVLLMPDYPAVPTPKTGVIVGSNRGTTCKFRTSDTGYDRCVVICECGTKNVVGLLYIQSGKTGVIRLPKGNYDMIFGMGEVWYGPERLFGDNGIYSIHEDDEIPSTNYTLTYTLGNAKKGNYSMSGLNYSDILE